MIAIIKNRNNLWGVISENDKKIIPCEYDEIKIYPNKCFVVKQNNKYGIFDKNGNQIAKVEYDKILPTIKSDRTYISNVAIAKDETRTEWIDTVFDFDIAENAHFLLKKNNKWGLAHYSTKWIIEPTFEKIRPIDEVHDFSMIAIVKIKELWGVINNKGGFVISAEYDKIGYDKVICENLLIEKNGLKGLVNQEGEMMVPVNYDMITPLRNGDYIIRKNGLRGLYGNHKEILPCEYDLIDTYNAGHSAEWAVTKNGKKGIFNRPLETITLPCKYDFLYIVNEEIRIATENNIWGIINSADETILPFEYDTIEALWGNAYIKKDNLWGVYNLPSQKVIVEPYYNEIKKKRRNENFFIVKKNNSWGIIDGEDKVIKPLMYNIIERADNDCVLFQKKGENFF